MEHISSTLLTYNIIRFARGTAGTAEIRMDTITTSFFEDFCKRFGYTGQPEEEAQFERFAAYSIVSKYFSIDTLDKTLLESVCIGGGNDWGIDTFTIIVNNRIVSQKEEIDQLLATNGYLDVKFIFIQSKRSRNFDAGECSKFLNGVRDVFSLVSESGHYCPPANIELSNYLELVQYIYRHASKFKERKYPQAFCYYVITGKPEKTNKDAVSCKQRFIHDIGCLNLLELKDELLYIYGSLDLLECYKETLQSDEVEITVDKSIVLPDMEGVKEGYEFLLPFKEFLKIIESKDKTLKNIFNDNIRAYQGKNSVNQAIEETLKRGDFALFTAMNNGITIIAKDMQAVGSKFIIKDYQIVNGCQTTNVLYNNRNLNGIDKLQLSVRLIASHDASIRDKIIMGTNSQTAVTKEQLLSLSKIQTRIEDIYAARRKDFSLYYERRSKQYLNNSSVPPSCVITISVQIMSFVSMIMSEPHRVNGYYGDVINFYEKINKKLFSSDYVPDLYYLSGLTYYKMMQLFSAGRIDRKYKPIRLHILLAFRLVNESQKLPDLNSERRIIPYCDSMITKLCDKELCIDGFLKAVELIDKVLEGKITSTTNQDANFTDNLKRVVYQEMQ